MNAELPETPAQSSDASASEAAGHRPTILSEGTVDVPVVPPCLNEEQTVASCVSKARRWFDVAQLAGEVIVVDNGSTDRSREQALAAGARVFDESQRGKQGLGRIVATVQLG